MISEIRRHYTRGRRLRSYPRVVKRKHVGAKLRKRPGHTETRHDTPPHLHILTNTA